MERSCSARHGVRWGRIGEDGVEGGLRVDKTGKGVEAREDGVDKRAGSSMKKLEEHVAAGIGCSYKESCEICVPTIFM